MHGEGVVFTWPNGRKYIGSFANDKKEGYGIHEWMDGRKYRGYWHLGRRHGEGEYFNPKNGVWKKGFWVDDIRTRSNSESITNSNRVSN